MKAEIITNIKTLKDSLLSCEDYHSFKTKSDKILDLVIELNKIEPNTTYTRAIMDLDHTIGKEVSHIERAENRKGISDKKKKQEFIDARYKALQQMRHSVALIDN